MKIREGQQEVKQIMKTPSPPPLFPSWAILSSPNSTGRWGMGATVGSSQVVSAAVQREEFFPCSIMSPSHGRQFSTKFSSVSHSHRLQFFINCSRVGCFHRTQSFGTRLFQRGFPAGSQILPENLLTASFGNPHAKVHCTDVAWLWLFPALRLLLPRQQWHPRHTDNHHWTGLASRDDSAFTDFLGRQVSGE